jgi:hypothetical protein
MTENGFGKRKRPERREPAGILRAGVGRSEITVRKKGVAVNDPLYAKTLVLDDGNKKIVIIAMDVVGIGGISDVADDFLPKLRARISEKHKIDGRDILVNASHTHPPGRMLCSDKEQLDRVFAAVTQALGNMEEVRVGAGRGYEDRIMINRTLRLKDGKSRTVRHANPCPPDGEVKELGPVDPEIGLIRIDRLDGSVKAVLYNFACHPLLGVPGGAVTANYPGFASKVIEESIGGGALALFLQGAGGDITEVLYKDVNQARDSEPVGTLLGLSALKGLEKIRTGLCGFAAINETVLLPRRTDIPDRIGELLYEQHCLLESLRSTSLNFRAFLPLYLKYALNPEFPADYSYRYLHEEKIGAKKLKAMDKENRANIEKYLRNIDAMERLARIQDKIETLKFHQELNDKSGEKTIAAEVQGIRIGASVIITSPAELLVEVGLNLKKASSHQHTLVAAFSNGYIHYGAPAAAYARGGYEVTECLLAPEWQAIYEKKAKDIMRRLAI